jgi:phage portal protein BeeE
MENSENAIIDKEILKQIGSSLKPSPSRSLSYDPTKNMSYMMNKGLRKPGRVSFDVLRRASYSVHVARICINVLKEKITKTNWLIKPVDPLLQVDDKRRKELEDFFKHPNKTQDTFRTLLDKMLEDLLVLDAVSLEKTRYPNGRLAEIYYVDSATIRPVYDEYGQQDIIIPLRTEEDLNAELPVSFVQVLNNSQYGGPESGDIVAAWPKKDFMYFMMHPQGAMEKFGYGMSPLESVMSVVANLLNADNYNGTYFEEGSMPPVIIQMMSQINERDLQAMREYMYSELQGSFHRPAIVGGKGEMKLLNLKEFSNKDMEFQDYMKFMARLMAAAYGLAAQDIGLTDDLNRATSEVQKDLSETKGYGSILHLLKETFNQEIVWKDFGYTEFEFDWTQPDTMDAKDAMLIYDQALKNGTMTLNEIREKLGETPYGEWADIPMVLTSEGFTNIVKQAEPKETTDPHKPFPGSDKIVGGEKPYEEQAEKVVQKSILTDDGYKTFMDDRGYSQPFVYVEVLKNKGLLIKPPVAVNLMSQDLEIELSQALRKKKLNVPNVYKLLYVDVVKIFPSNTVKREFAKYVEMAPEYDSEKWRAKFGGSRRFPLYLIEDYIVGRSLKDTLLLEDMRRDPDSYKEAIKDLANLWKVERDMVLGDRRADQYLITNEKRAWGIDYQFKDDKKRWEDTQYSIHVALNAVPTLKKLFEAYIGGDKETVKSMLKKGALVQSVVQSPRQSFESNPVMFGELIINDAIKESAKVLFSKQSASLLSEMGFKEDSFMYDFNQAMNRLEEFVTGNPKCYGGVLTLDDILGKKYYVYVKESTL